MIRTLWTALMAVVLILSGCEGSILDPTTHVTGKVIDHVSKQPLSGVTVLLSENDDVWTGGGHVIAEQLTDANGNFSFTFEWKESPYKLRVQKQGYTYTHTEYNEKHKVQPITKDYQPLEILKKNQDFLFDMEPVGTLLVNIINSEPQPSSSKLIIKFENVNKGRPVVGPEVYPGTSIREYSVGSYAIANKHVRYTYTIEKNGASHTTTDSILIKHITPTPLEIIY